MMGSVALPSQEELRRRVKAGRHLAGYTSTKELAVAIGDSARLGERTLRKLEAGERDLQLPHLRVIAESCDLPVEFFTVASIGDAIRASTRAEADESLAARVADLEAKLGSLEARQTDALGLLEQALPDLVPGLRRSGAEAPSDAPARGRRRSA